MAKKLPLIFPIHPRTRGNLRQFKLEDRFKAVHLVEPLGYLEFLALQKNAALVVTDLGGMQEESTYFGNSLSYFKGKHRTLHNRNRRNKLSDWQRDGSAAIFF